MEKQVEHEGTVVSGSGNTITVRIVAAAACAGCAAEGYCVPAANRERDIRVEGRAGDFAAGERVKVLMRQSLGFRALLLAYVLPLFVVILTLPAIFLLTGSELASGAASILVLIPYYIILKLFRPGIDKKFVFAVEKMN